MPAIRCVLLSLLMLLCALSRTTALGLQLYATAGSCTTTSVGRIPINDLGTGYYQGYQGGLYPGGFNVRPAPHDSAGRALAAQVVPRDTAGNIDLANGRIVLLSIGMSNATQEYSVFKQLADADSMKNPRLTIVDGAQGGQTAAIISNPNAQFWTVIDQRLAAAGARRAQVQAAWVKEANANPQDPFPRHAQILDSQFVLIARILKQFYPNIKLAYWSSRTYGGYATTTLNPEPYAYESGFAVKWTITRQIDGDSALSYTEPQPRAPWLAWGPYLWADGLVPRSDSLIWLCDDFVPSDRTHPSASGRLKVAQMLLRFFKSDSTTRGWFLRPGATTVKEHPPRQFALYPNYPNPFNPVTHIRFEVPQTGVVSLKVYTILGQEVATFVNDTREAGTHAVRFDGSSLPSGVYIAQLRTGSFIAARKLLLMR